MRSRIGRRTCRERGFTLIEIVVVLAVIGLMAAILTPLIRTYVEDARRSRAEGDIQQIAAAIVRLAKDVDHSPAYTDGKKTAGAATIDLLCGPGNLPIRAGDVTGWDGLPGTSTPCATGSEVDRLENHLIVNRPGGNTSTPYATGHQGRVWRGPYLEKITEDSYGNAYVVNILNAPADSSGSDRVVWVCSAGPDGVISTPGDSLAASGPAVQGDDVCLRLK